MAKKRAEDKRRSEEDGEQLSAALHRSRCQICKHPEREEIEREFLHWVSPRELAERWKTGSYRSIYRHAHATGLYERRRKNRQAALDRIIERVGEVQVTAAAVIAAIRLAAKLDREEKEEKETRGVGGRQVPFVLSMDGLPRTNAVTGRAPDEGARGNVPLPSTREQKQAEAGDEATAGNEATAGREKGARTGMSAPQGAERAAMETDPRIALGEHGWVAGMPWPKGKVTFAQRRRWRPGRPGRYPGG